MFPASTRNAEQLGYYQESSVEGKRYEWQLSNGHTWMPIANDHVIETHYCQPGAKGITINFSNQQKVFIDFDQLETLPAGLKVQRLSFLLQGQTEDVGWYFRDDQLWREYGSQISGSLSSSISSLDVEHQFSQNRQGAFSFTVGSTGYTLDFSTMTQTNCNTGLQRKVRRRPKFTSNTESFYSSSGLPSASSSQLTDGGYKWEFMGEEGQWTEYKAHLCSFDSGAIEKQYQMNPRGQLRFKVRTYSYTLDFSSMSQVNERIGTRRAVRRTVADGSQQSSSLGSQPRWQFQDVGGIWKDYSEASSISSQNIELQYQQNPSGSMVFYTKNFSYQLDFSAMTQMNLSTTTTRSVRRLNQ
ncbi:uncharacterized protein si:ch211-244b2.3 [Centropristis striata]|uniref:uncharacterized protein si:ch211-244b2.3 n=1 Tax=Centropristis striata TaxID=184440 RepID=UPI0027DF8534|nr:uncharacterized protein si:ch211-244b2.3 [Centropristis striata]